MLVEYAMLLSVMVILLIGRILSDRIHDRDRWFYFYEQKRMTSPTPRMIVLWQEIPVHYQSCFSPHEPLPYMLHIPGSPSVLLPRKEVLLVLHNDRLTLYEGNPASGQEIAFDDILFIEHGKMLFSFWLRIVCKHQTYRVPYRTMGDDAFSRIIERIRLQSHQGAPPVSTRDVDPERKQLDWLANIHYQFMNMAQSSLLPGQRIVAVLFQPSSMRKEKTYVRFLSRTRIYNPHLAVMTDHELILIQKREPIQTITYDQYSVKTLFIPYQNIHAFDIVEDKRSDVFQLTLALNDQISLPLFFTTENAKAQTFFNTLSNALHGHAR